MAKSVLETVLYYKEMEDSHPTSGILREVKYQYADMANGGDGGELGFEQNGARTCRGVNYPNHSDAYFQEVCALLGWEW